MEIKRKLEAILISDKIDFKNCYKRQRRTLHNDQNINSRRIYNNCKYICTQQGAPQYIRQILTAIKEEIDSNTIVVGDFNTPLSSMDRSSRQKINEETQALNDTLQQMDLIDFYRAFHPKAAERVFCCFWMECSVKIN